MVEHERVPVGVAEDGHVADARVDGVAHEPDAALIDICLPPTKTDEGLVAELTKRGPGGMVQVRLRAPAGHTVLQMLDRLEGSVQR